MAKKINMVHKTLSLALSCALGICTTIPAWSAEPSPTPTTTTQHAPQQLWLIEHLPAQTQTYLRIPPLWSWILPNNPQVPEIKQSAEKIRPQLASLIIKNFFDLEPALSLLLAETKTPFEIAITDLNTEQQQIYYSFMLPQWTAKQVDELMVRMNKNQTVRTNKPGIGVILKYNKVMAAYYFDENSGRLLLISGDNITADDWSWTQQKTALGLRKRLQQVDEAHSDFFIWQNNLLMPSLVLATKNPLIAALGLQNIRSATFSTQWQKHYIAQISLHAPASIIGLQTLFPVDNSQAITLKTQNEPQWAIMLTIPNADAINDIITAMQQYGEKIDNNDTNNDLLQRFIHALSGRILIVADDNGTVIAIEKRRKAQLNSLIALLKENGLLVMDETIGHGIRHLKFLYGDTQEVKEPSILQAMNDAPSDIYLMADGDYLLLTGLPQPLLARLTQAPQTDFGDWMRRAGVDFAHDNFAYVQPMRHLNTEYYYDMLDYLQWLSNVSKTPLDMAQFPIAQALKDKAAPEALALTLRNTNNALSLQFHSPHTILDWLYLLGSPTQLIAIAATATAIAIPAYEDYLYPSKL